jgi:hypothetical protein
MHEDLAARETQRNLAKALHFASAHLGFDLFIKMMRAKMTSTITARSGMRSVQSFSARH